MKTFYITTPIYYVNDLPHVGHAYTTIVADFIARWHRLHGRPVWFLTGTDEHGPKNQQAAEERGLTPQQWVDEIVPRWKELWTRLEISNDDFIRTTEDRHKLPVASFMRALYEKGEIYLGTYEGAYCVRCEEFKSESELVDGNCPIHGSPVQRLSEQNYFFRLSTYTQRLLRHIEEHPEFVQPQRARNELLGKLRLGLRDIPISRPNVYWGIPIPWDEGHVVYVWIEALQNYITAAGYGSDDERFARLWPADVHLIGKEIVWHHAVVWPALLLAAGVELPRTVFAHGWLLAGGEKISKSGKSITQISPHELADRYGVDAYRYHFLRATPFGEDGNFSLEDLEARYNAELANDLGNLASRVVAMVERYFEGVVPEAVVVEEPEKALLKTIEDAGSAADLRVSDFKVTEALGTVWEIVRHANRYLVEREPWKLARDEAKRPVVAGTLNTAAEALRAVAVLLSPAIPGASRELWTRLGYVEPSYPRIDAPSPSGNRVRTGPPLFPRLESERPDQEERSRPRR